MDVTIKKIQDLWVCITITIPCENVHRAYYEKLISISKSISICGFRVGKVPVAFLQKKYGELIRQEVISKLMVQTFSDCIAEKKISLISNPTYNIVCSCGNTEKNFVYTVTTEIYPYFNVKGLDDIKIKKPSIMEITKDDIGLFLKIVSDPRIHWKCSDKKIGFGDRVTFSIRMVSFNKQYKNTNTGDIVIIINKSNPVLCLLEEKMLNCNVGDNFNIHVNVPSDYHLEDFRGKCITFTVIIKQVETPEFLELNQYNISSFDTSTCNVHLDTKICEYVKRSIRSIIQDNIKDQVMNSILCANDVVLPSTLIERERYNLMLQFKKPYSIHEKFKIKSLHTLFLREFNLEEQVKRRVKIALLLNEIMRKNNMQLDYVSVQKTVSDVLNRFGFSDKKIRLLKKNVIAMRYLRHLILEEEVVNFILNKAEVVEEKITFNDLIAL